MNDLYKELIEYSKTDYYPFHMPGHKRNMKEFDHCEMYQMDITEIDGFDNLHDARGIILEAEKRAATLYQSQKTYFLINGSTCGILAAVHMAVKPGGKILLSRNSHKAAYHAVFLRGLQVEYLYPGWNSEFDIQTGIKARDVEEALSLHPDIEAVFITSPTFDGVVSDVEEIARIAHNHQVPLIVDEAHGAHFGLYNNEPESKRIPLNSIEKGADLVIHSLHKTLPSLTQTALLHVNGNLMKPEQAEKYLGIFETSSPSYLLMASMDRCMDIIEKKGRKLFQDYLEHIQIFMKKVGSLKYIQVAIVAPTEDGTVKDMDPGKFIISVKKTSFSGQQFYDILRIKYHLQLEMAATSYVLAIITIMDKETGFNRLAEALIEEDQLLSGYQEKSFGMQGAMMPPKTAYYTITEADGMKCLEILLKDSIGEVSGEWVSIYPPGIPFLVPGEIIDEATVKEIEKAVILSLPLQGLSHIKNGKINIVSKKK